MYNHTLIIYDFHDIIKRKREKFSKTEDIVYETVGKNTDAL